MDYNNYNLPFNFQWNNGAFITSTSQNISPYSGSMTPQSFPSTTLSSGVSFVPSQQQILPQMSANIIGHTTPSIPQPSAIIQHTPSKHHQPTVVQHQPTVVQPQPTVIQPQPTVIQPQPTVVQPQPTVVHQIPQHPQAPVHPHAPQSNGFNGARYPTSVYPNYGGVLPLTSGVQSGNYSYHGNASSVSESVLLDKVENVKELKNVEQQIAERMTSLLSNPQVLRSVLLQNQMQSSQKSSQGNEESLPIAKKEYINIDNLFTDVSASKVESPDPAKSLKSPFSVFTEDIMNGSSSESIAKIVQATLEAASVKNNTPSSPSAVPSHTPSTPTSQHMTTDMIGLFQDQMNSSIPTA